MSKELGVKDFSPKINKHILGNKTHRTLLEPSLTQKQIHIDKSILIHPQLMTKAVEETPSKTTFLKKKKGINPSMQPFKDCGKTMYPEMHKKTHFKATQEVYIEQVRKEGEHEPTYFGMKGRHRNSHSMSV